MGLRGRTRVLSFIVVLAVVVLSGRLIWIQGVKAAEIVERVEDFRLVRQTLQPERGSILDRNGRVLAMTVTTYTVVADTRQIKPDDYPKVAGALASALGLDAAAIQAKLEANPNSGYVPLKHGLDLETRDAVAKLRLPGIDFEARQERRYPQGRTANQVLGYMNDGKGEYGLEARYESELAGKPGYIISEVTSAGTPIEGTVKEQVDPEPGKTLVLTLDAGLQQVVEKKLEEFRVKADAKRALFMAMDVHTGEILVMAMTPGADPGDRSTWGDPVDFTRIINWAVTPLPPGSVFKIITTAAALEERVITLDTPIVDAGYLNIDGTLITNWDGVVPEHPTPMTIAKLLQNSSNVGLVQVGQRLTHEQFVKYLEGFGFLEPTGIDFSHEESATIGTPFEQKRPIDWANMYIGQHLEVTPLQMLTAVAAIANGGKLMQPHLVREIRNPDGTVVWTAPTQPKRVVISETTAREVRDLMVSVVEKGTGSQAQIKGYKVGGKTGTAQKYENGVEKPRGVADFVGFAPADDPRVAMIVVFDEPAPPGYGGLVAAPAFAALAPLVLQAMGIPPETEEAAGTEPTAQQQVVPNVQWLPADWAQRRLSEAGFTAKVTGSGDVVASQSPAPGSPAKAGTAVELKLAARSGAETEVPVPDFTGLSLTEANRLAQALGLTLKPRGSGFVTDQDPKPGARVPAHGIVTVRLGPRR
ncbi:MAG TPA: penicillin-binding transpeptidase domain-containing protein [Symbiobacteriaceae bacterium]